MSVMFNGSFTLLLALGESIYYAAAAVSLRGRPPSRPLRAELAAFLALVVLPASLARTVRDSSRSCFSIFGSRVDLVMRAEITKT